LDKDFCGGVLPAKKRILLEAEEGAVRGDHDVVQDFDSEELACLHKPVREGAVLAGRTGVSGRVVAPE
jgi:hypothetical protein